MRCAVCCRICLAREILQFVLSFSVRSDHLTMSYYMLDDVIVFEASGHSACDSILFSFCLFFRICASLCCMRRVIHCCGIHHDPHCLLCKSVCVCVCVWGDVYVKKSAH